jgi:two-component system, LytTR family, response regulator AlgR
MKILIVDDEKLARERLRDLIGDIEGEVEFLEADNGVDCLALANKESIDIILLDIRMPGMDGLETAYHLAALQPPPAIIFTTAYQDHAIDAFNANAVDYLLKPIRGIRLQEAMERASFINRARLSAIDENSDNIKGARSYLSANNQGNIELIPIKEIRYLKADQKYVTACWPGHEVLIDDPLKSLETEFGDHFIRVHRNALVGLSHIEALEKDNEGKFHLRLHKVDERIDVSRRHLHDVRQAVKKLGLSNN